MIVVDRSGSMSGEKIEQAQNARLHVFGVRYDVNTHLLDSLALENSGSITYQPGENLEIVLTGFYNRIANPVLTDIEIAFEGVEVSDLYPQKLPELYQGSSLSITGRYRASAPSVTVRVRGKARKVEREFIYHFDLDQTSGHNFVPRLWATRRIGQLLDQGRVEGESDALVEEIRTTGLGYGLVTPYTTFVITPQLDGAASQTNMDLYNNLAELNQLSGETTVQARVQNQSYQQAEQASMATGANVIDIGQNSLVQVASQNLDLSLLQGVKYFEGPVTEEWIDENIEIDRYVVFGSDEYFTLAGDLEIRTYLQSGPEVVFAHGGEVISVKVSAEGPALPPEKLTKPEETNWLNAFQIRMQEFYIWVRQVFGK